MQTRDQAFLGTEPVGRLLMRLAIPTVIAQLVNMLYNIVDRIYIGHISGIGAAALTGVGLFTPILMLLNAFAMLIGSGGAPRTAIAMGQGDKKQAEKIVSNSFTMLLLFSVVLTIVFYAAAPTLLRLFGASDTTLPYALTYSRIYILGTICVLIVLGMNTFITAQGFAKISMLTTVIGAVINIVLAPILIFGLLGFPKMGIAGAAWATVIGQCLGAVVAVTLNHFKNPEVHLRLRHIRPNGRLMGEITAISIPSIIMSCISSLTCFVMNMILIAYSSTAVAVFGVYFKLQSFVFMPVFGLNNGMVPIIAYNYGAQKPERIHKTIRLGMVYAVAIMVIGLLVFQLIPKELLLMFDASDAMLEIGAPALRIMSLAFVFAGIGIVSGSACQAFGYSVYSMLISIARQIVVLIPAAYLLSLTGVLRSIWFAFPIAEIFSLILSLFFLRTTLKKTGMAMPKTK